jgi:3-oxoacyl-ACP reductase-like protein
MSSRRTVVRSISIAAVVVAVLVFMLSRRDEPAPEPEVAAAPSEPEVPEVEEPVEPRAAPAPAPTPTRAPEPEPTAEAPAPAPTDQPPDAGPPEPFTPELREHALLMITPMAKLAMESHDVTQLKSIRDMVKERNAVDKLMGESDLEALELSIGCLERSPEAREEARDLLEFGQPTMFGDSFKRACFDSAKAPQ